MIKKRSDIKAILFDLDDTLINSAKAQYNAICEFKKTYSEFKNVDDQFFADLWQEISEQEYERYLNNEISFEKMRASRIRRLFLKYSSDISEEYAIKLFDKYIDYYKRNWRVFDDTYLVLEQIRKTYKIAIVSNGDSMQQREKLIHTGLDDYFSTVIISGEVGYSKPDKRIFEEACKELNLKPENCIMIGDKYNVDIDGALNAGMMAIWVNRKNEKNDYKYQIKELTEIITILKKY